MEKFFEKLDSALKNNSFVKMTLSKPVSKNNDLRNIYIKPILLKDNNMYQFTYRYDRRDETKNFTVKSPSSPLNSPALARVFSFCVASTALLIISRKKISFSEYKNFLITGKMFSVLTPIDPFDIILEFLISYFLFFICPFGWFLFLFS